MANIALAVPALSPLQELQQAFCLLNLAGDLLVGKMSQIDNVRNGVADGLQMSRMTAGRLLMRRHLEALAIPSDPSKEISDFLVSPNTVVYDRIAFSPLPTPATTLNLWKGSTVTPKLGDWNALKAFLLEVIADGDIGLYRYLIMFLAHALQKPEEKPGVMLSMMGGQGTGKGSVFRMVERIWSATTLLVSDVDNVIGKFNAAIESKFMVCMDEALFAGDKKAMDRLKSLVTEPRVTIEEKNQPRRNIESFHRFLSATNHAHFAQVDADDRRMVFFQVSDARRGDHAYWTKVHAAIDDPAVIAAMVHDLLDIDLSNFAVRVRPKTSALVDQKIRSLSGFDRYWFELLQSGLVGSSIFPDPHGTWTAPCFISTSGLKSGLAGYEKGQRQYGPRQEREIHQALERLCPSAKVRRVMKNGVQQRGYQLPALAIARTEFETFLGGGVEWV